MNNKLLRKLLENQEEYVRMRDEHGEMCQGQIDEINEYIILLKQQK